MSTQDDQGIPWTYAHEQQGLRLLELPSELLDLFNSEHPPRLQLKSDPPPSSTDITSKPAHAVLCTPNQTYQLRQVQTSNSVFVLRPTILQQDPDKPPIDAICAAATCTSSLELQTQTPSDQLKLASPADYLIKMLPLFDPEEDSPNIRPNTKFHVFADIPWSEQECEQAWVELVAFEHRGHSFRPLASQLVGLWTCIMRALTTSSVSYVDLFSSPDVQSECEAAEYPPSLVDAVAQRISEPTSWNKRVDKNKLVPWVGEILLSNDAETSANPGVWESLEKWKSLLPENLRESITTSDVMNLRGTLNPTSNAANSTATPDAGVKRPSARNWHEKLKRPKR